MRPVRRDLQELLGLGGRRARTARWVPRVLLVKRVQRVLRDRPVRSVKWVQRVQRDRPVKSVKRVQRVRRDRPVKSVKWVLWVQRALKAPQVRTAQTAQWDPPGRPASLAGS